MAVLEDGGERHDYETGATREPNDGKGRYELISPLLVTDILALMDDRYSISTMFNKQTVIADVVVDLYKWMEDESLIDLLHGAIRWAARIMSLDDQKPLLFTVTTRLALHYENGVKKYASRNWEKGIPVSRCFDSAVRHLLRYADGGSTEDHLAAFIWNITAILHYYRYDLYARNACVMDLDMPWRSLRTSKVLEEIVRDIE